MSDRASHYPKFALLALVGFALAQAQPGQRQPAPENLPPSPLEAFAAQSSAKVVFSKTVGHFDSRGSHAVLTIIVAEDQVTPKREMRGLRIDLLHHDPSPPPCDWKYSAWQIMCQRPNASIYIEEARLEKVRDQLNRGVAELRHMEFISEYSSSLPSSGLIVCGYDFPDRRATELMALLTRAIAELRNAER